MLSGVKGGRSESTNRQDLEDFVSGAHMLCASYR